MGVTKRNGNFWIDYYDSNGKRHRKKIGTQKTLAQIALKDVKVKIAKGEYLGIYEEKKVLFKGFCENVYIPYCTTHLSEKTFIRCEGIIRTHLIKSFEGYLFKITREDIERYKQKRAAIVSPSTVNREFSRLRHLFKCAENWGYVKNNPCKGIKELKEPSGRIRYLTIEEMEKLLSACESSALEERLASINRTSSKWMTLYLKPIVQLLIHTGLRRSELLSLRWSDLDFREKRITVEKTKNNERRIIYMNDTVYNELKALPVLLHNNMVFPGVNGDMLTNAFIRLCKKIGIHDFRLHDLRHTFASHLIMSGANIRTVQTLLGHRDLRMTMRYSHLSPEHLQDAVNKLDRTLNLNSNGHYMVTKGN